MKNRTRRGCFATIVTISEPDQGRQEATESKSWLEGGLAKKVAGSSRALTAATTACVLLSGALAAQDLLVVFGDDHTPGTKAVFQRLNPNPATAVSPVLSSVDLSGLQGHLVRGFTAFPGVPPNGIGAGKKLYIEKAQGMFTTAGFNPGTGVVTVATNCDLDGWHNPHYTEHMVGYANEYLTLSDIQNQGGPPSWNLFIGTDSNGDGHSVDSDTCNSSMPLIASLPFAGPYVGPVAANQLPYSTYDSDAYVMSLASGGGNHALHRINPDTLASLISWPLDYAGLVVGSFGAGITGFTVGTDNYVYALASYHYGGGASGELRLIKSTIPLGLVSQTLPFELLGDPLVDWVNGNPQWALTPAMMLFDGTSPQILSLTANGTPSTDPPLSVQPCTSVDLCASWSSGPATGTIQPGNITIANGECVTVYPPAGATTQYTLRVTGLGPNLSHTGVPVAQDAIDVMVGDSSCEFAVTIPNVFVPQPFDNTCVPDVGSPPCARKGLWYTFNAPYTGMGNFSTNTAGSQLAIYSAASIDPCSSLLLEGCDLGTTGVDFQMYFGQRFYVEVGSAGAAAVAGDLVFSGQPAPNCPDMGIEPSRTQLYGFSGTANGTPWAWKIVSADNSWQEIYCGLGPIVPANSQPEVIASMFADSINEKVGENGLGCAPFPGGELSAKHNPTGLAAFGYTMSIEFRSAMPEKGLELYVGPVNCVNCCLVDVFPPTTPCQFAFGGPGYSVEKIDVPEDDCNQNGVPDLLDVATGLSQDVNGDSIPDECADLGMGYCYGDTSGNACPCGANGNPGDGCANTSGVGGVTLAASGNAYLGNDTFRIQVVGAPGSKPGLLLRGANQLNGGLGNLVGDGLLCTSGSTARSHVQITSNGSTLFTQFRGQPFGFWSYGAGTPVNYQFWYRDPGNMCSGSGFNFSNAWTVTWQL